MQVPNVCTMSSLNPTPSNNDDDDEGIGRRFMALVRSTEKQENDNNELSDLLETLISLYSRQGLLQGNTERAQRVMESSTSNARGGKRNSANDSINTATLDDESLVLSALVRIFTPKENSSSTIYVALAGDVCTAICAHVQDVSGQTACARAEEEILFKSSRPLLTGLGGTIKGLASLSNRTVQQTLALISCVQATTCLIAVLGARVHRPTIATIRQAAWKGVVDSNPSVRQSSALLLSILPLTGVGNIPPADAWSTSVSDVVVSLVMVLNVMAPLRPQQTESEIVSEEIQSIVSEWIDSVRKLDNEAERVACFQLYSQGLTSLLVALLTRQAYDPETTRMLMMTSRLPIESLLDVCETMIQFPSAAETVFFSTKKRLRMEVVQGGLLSPAAVVLEMANLIKNAGHDILDATISASSSSLLPFARNVMRITESSLLSSTSTALQRALDPTKSVLQRDENRKQWLQNSVVLRTRAIKTFGMSIQTLGASVLAGPLENDQEAMRNGTKTRNEMLAVSSVAGSLLEQLAWPKEPNDDWATLSERVELCVGALNVLATVLTTGGGYLPLSCRSLIDSIASTCFSSICFTAKQCIATWPSVKVAILKLGSVCMTTPWPDGAMSSLLTELRHAASCCTRDCDENVAAEAESCLRLCNALSTPRVPALSIVTSREQGQNTQTAFSLVESLKTAREDTTIADTLAAKPSRPLEESPKNVQNEAKRQKVVSTTAAKAPADPAKSATLQPTSKTGPKLVPVANDIAKLQAEHELKQKTQTEEKVKKVVAVESQARASAKSEASSEQQPLLETKEGTDGSRKHLAPASLKKDPDEDSDDDFDDFPEIVVDGGPDEEDQ